MANWLEHNQTTSVIVYSLLIAGATWGTSYFILDENKVNLFKAQVENEKTKSSQLETKISVLEGRILDLSNDNKQLRLWLSDDSSSYPILVSKIEKLELEIKENSAIAAGSTQAEGEEHSSREDKPYSYSERFVKGQSFSDPLTNATIGVSQIAIDNTADIFLYLPGRASIEKKGVKPGSSWTYKYKNKQYKLTLNNVEWLANILKATVVEM